MNPIGASELIITQKGSVYHLDLRPEQLADTVITVGDPDRVPMVSRHFDTIEFQEQHREFVTHTGYIGKKRLMVVSTGIGPDNIDIVLNELDALANIDFEQRMVKEQQKSLTIIRLGTSGALQPEIAVDSVVASSFGLGLDNLMHYYQYEPNEEENGILEEFKTHTNLAGKAIQPYIAKSSKRLLDHLGKALTTGITVTCPGFYGPQGRVLRAPIAFPNLIDSLASFESHGHRITNFEMETSAIYGLGKLLGHHCLSLNVIIANRVQKNFSRDAGKAIEKMIVDALEKIEKIDEKE